MASELSILPKIYAFVSNVRTRKIRFLLLAVDDYELYQYHKPFYRGIVQRIIEFSRFIEERKTSIFDESSVGFLVRLHSWLPSHAEEANRKHLLYERRDNGLLQNLVSYFALEAPLTLGYFILSWMIFKMLFKHSVSSFFRVFSFPLFLWDMLYCDNVQYFTFLSFSSFSFMHFRAIADKCDSIFCLLFFFSLLMYCLYFYYSCRLSYGKLGKYFLENLYRIKSCLLFGYDPSIWSQALTQGSSSYLIRLPFAPAYFTIQH